MADVNLTSGTSATPSITGNIAKSINGVDKLSASMTKLLGLSGQIAKNMGFGGSFGGGGAGNLTTSGSFTGGTPGGGMGTMSGLGATIQKVGAFALGTVGAAATAMPNVQDVLSNQLLTSQARFSGFQGNVGGTIQAAMRQGTAASTYDAIQAVSQGTAAGLMPALPGYGNILTGVSQISNLTGSFSSAMSATTALNQAPTVNRLRMFGINARNNQGVMRNPADIFKDVYAFASKNSGKTLTRQDVAIGLQSGNGLSNFLDNIAGGDPALRSSLQTAAVQFSQGGNLTRASTEATGQTTAASATQSDLYASKYGLSNAAAPAMSAGFIEGARLLTQFNDKMSNLISTSSAAAGALKQLAKAETMAADNLGQAGLGLMALIGGAFAGGGLLSGKGGASAAGKFLSKGVRAGAIGLIGNVAGNIVSSGAAAGSTQDRLGSAVSWGASGAAIGSFGGPLGILAGGAIGGAFGYFKSGGLGLGADITNSNASTIPGGGANLSALSAGSSMGSAAIAVAQTQIGVPYSWGGGSNSGPTAGQGSGKNTTGFDCSSFTRFVMAKLGVALPRTAHDQQKYGRQISPKDAQPGDLLFWDNPATHVAIYMGNGRIIQAPHTGANVEEAGVNLETVTSACRVVNGATGTSELTNLLNVGGGSAWGGAGGSSAVAPSVTATDLMGYTPASAMSGGGSVSSGLGMGSSSGMSSSASSSGNMARQYMFINSKTGKLDSSVDNGGGQTTVNYGGVTIKVDVPQGAKIDEKQLSKLIKEELLSIDISAKVATQ